MHRFDFNFAFACCCCAAVLVGCRKAEDRAADTAAATDTTAAAAPPAAAPAAPTTTAISLADVAGKWRVRAMPESGDSTVVTFEMTATRDTTGWSNKFPNRPPVPVRVVAVAGDSVVTEAGPYESVLRKGVRVRTHSVARLQGDRLVGTTVARYQTTGADSVRRFRFEGTRSP